MPGEDRADEAAQDEGARADRGDAPLVRREADPKRGGRRGKRHHGQPHLRPESGEKETKFRPTHELPSFSFPQIFMAAECVLELRSERGGTRTVKMDGGFYTGYRRNILAPDEVLVSLSVPFTAEDEHFVAFKQAKRRDDDIAIVNSAFFFKLSGSGEIQVNAPLLFVPTPALNSLPDG